MSFCFSFLCGLCSENSVQHGGHQACLALGMICEELFEGEEKKGVVKLSITVSHVSSG